MDIQNNSANWTNLFGAILVFVLVILIVVMFWNTEGNFSQSHWAAFYIGVGLVTGLSFWIITGAAGELDGKFGGIGDGLNKRHKSFIGI